MCVLLTQERDAASRFIRNVFPDAEIRATQLNERPTQVKISCEGNEIICVPQRDLFSKYGWPAEDEVTAALVQFKEESKSWLGVP